MIISAGLCFWVWCSFNTLVPFTSAWCQVVQLSTPIYDAINQSTYSMCVRVFPCCLCQTCIPGFIEYTNVASFSAIILTSNRAMLALSHGEQKGTAAVAIVIEFVLIRWEIWMAVKTSERCEWRSSLFRLKLNVCKSTNHYMTMSVPKT